MSTCKGKYRRWRKGGGEKSAQQDVRTLLIQLKRSQEADRCGVLMGRDVCLGLGAPAEPAENIQKRVKKMKQNRSKCKEKRAERWKCGLELTPALSAKLSNTLRHLK